MVLVMDLFNLYNYNLMLVVYYFEKLGTSSLAHQTPLVENNLRYP